MWKWILSKIDGPFIAKAAAVVGGFVAVKLGALVHLTPAQVTDVAGATATVLTAAGGALLTHGAIIAGSTVAGNADAGK